MSKLVVALATLSAFGLGAAPEVAARRRPPPQDPPVARCDAHAPVLASVFGHVATAGNPNALPSDSLFSVRESGRWDFATVDPQSHVVGDAVSGCLDVPATDKLRATLRAAPWKTTPVVHCMAMSAASTEYVVGGNVVWTQRMCPPAKLDTVSAMAIAALDELAANARKSSATPPPDAGPPAACTLEGQPYFERSAIDDAQVGEITIAVYRNGAWLRTEKDSKKRVQTAQGCLTAAQSESIKSDLKSAPMKVTHNQITCRAFSARHTVYRVDGKDVWDQRLCGADSMDDVTTKAFVHIRDTLATVTKVDF